MAPGMKLDHGFKLHRTSYSNMRVPSVVQGIKNVTLAAKLQLHGIDGQKSMSMTCHPRLSAFMCG